MLNPNLEKGQYTPRLRELTGDALLLLMAGTDSTAHTLVTATYAMLTRPEMLQALVTELKEAIPKRDSLAEWSALEKLPYLRAVVEESLRYVSGPPGRLPRTVPSTGAVFCGRQIPPGTITTSGAYVHHRKPKAFEDPDTFRPERWLHGSTVEMEKESGDLLEGVADVYGYEISTLTHSLIFDLEEFQSGLFREILHRVS